MITNQEPILELLRQEQEREATRESQKKSNQVAEPKEQSSNDLVNKENTSEPTNRQQEQKINEPNLVINEEKLMSRPHNIFANKAQNENRVNIFANHKSVNLFSVTQKDQPIGLNIFTGITNTDPLIENDEDESLSEGSQNSSLQNKDQNIDQPQQKVMKYQYESTMKRLGQFKLIKFRNGSGATKDGVVLSLEMNTTHSVNNVLYLMLRSPATHITIYHAFFPKNTKIENFMNRNENIKMMVVKAKQAEQKIVSQRELVKLQFESEEESKKFKTLVEEYFKEPTQ